MKKIIMIAGLIVGLLMLSQVKHSYAQMGMMGDYYNNDSSNSSSISQTEQQNQQKLDAMVNDLLKAQNVSSKDKLDCSKISNDRLEKLGDSWMDVLIPDENAHQSMDNMMGGEGSQSLTNAHIGMAERYLGCQNTSGAANYGWMPMMGGFTGGAFPMMGWSESGYSNLTGGFGFGIGIVNSILGIVVFIDLILIGILLWKKLQK